MTTSLFAIGLMSGTSLDGVDLVYVQFDEPLKTAYKILHAKTYHYDDLWFKKLKNAFYQPADVLTKLNIDYGFFLGDLINQFISEFHLKTIDYISSHGHTVFHKPQERYTLQIGHGAAIAKATGYKVVCDFRTQDVIRGGEGAPLVPMGDKLLFSEYDYCLNIGGFANISYDENHLRKAQDVCPANILLNHLSEKLGRKYDDRGQIAKNGEINRQLLDELNSLPIYSFGNSMAFEHVIDYFLPLIENYQIPIENILRTLVEHIAIKISLKIKPSSSVLTTGGGAYNDFLIDRIKKISQSDIIIPDKKLIDYKEALIFALLGLLRLQNKNNILSSVTLVEADHSSGQIFLP